MAFAAPPCGRYLRCVCQIRPQLEAADPEPDQQAAAGPGGGTDHAMQCERGGSLTHYLSERYARTRTKLDPAPPMAQIPPPPSSANSYVIAAHASRPYALFIWGINGCGAHRPANYLAHYVARSRVSFSDGDGARNTPVRISSLNWPRRVGCNDRAAQSGRRRVETAIRN